MSRSLDALQGAIKMDKQNIAAAKVTGYKGADTTFSVNTVGTGRNAVSYVTTSSRTNFSQGSLQQTGVDSNIMLQGVGFIPVQQNPHNPNTAVVYTRAGGFDLDQFGNYRNAGGYSMMAWKLDESGNLPINNSLISSLVPVNISNVSATAIPTTKVTIAANVDASNEKLKGVGSLLKLIGSNAQTTPSSIIQPDDSRYGSLKYGDKIVLSVNGDPQKTATFMLGGITASYDPTLQNYAIFGATTPTQAFTFTNPPRTNDRQVVSGDKMIVSVGGTNTDITATTGGIATNNEFNSLATLANVLNGIDGITASVINNRLFVAPTDPNAALTFTNGIGGSRLVDNLGLTNIPANDTTTGVYRFNTMNSLKAQMLKSNIGMAATVVGNNLDFSVAVATNSLNVNVVAQGPRLVDALPILGDGTVAGRASITITSSMHGLQAGDYVRMNAIGGAHENGTYMVTKVLGPNQFQINVLTGANFAAGNAAANIGGGNPVTTWQRAPGQGYPTQTALTGADTITYAGVAVTFDITYAGGVPVGYVANDLIYISGLNNTVGVDVGVIPDGYYKVTALPGGNVVTFGKVGNGNFGAQVNVGLALALNGGNAFTQKVGTTNAGALWGNGINVDRPVMTTFPGEPRVRVYVQPGAPYQIGDQFTFQGTGIGTPIVHDNVSIATGANNPKTITAVGPGWIEFTGTLTGAPAGVADIPFQTLGAGGGVNANLFLNFNNRLYADLGLDPTKPTLTASYVPTDPTLSLSSQTKASAQVFSHAFNIVDSLGSEHVIMIYFSRVDNNRWAVEVASVKNADGSFDIQTTRADGQVASGYLNFNPDGSFAGAEGSLAAAVSFPWTNGSNPGLVTFDWGTIASTSGMRQVDSPNTVFNVDENGSIPGIATGMSIGEDGILTVAFSNGTSKKLYQIPVVDFINPLGLKASDGDTYIATRESGQYVLKKAATDTGTSIVSQSLELSNVDLTENILEVQELVDNVQANAVVLGTDRQNWQNIIQAIR